MAFYESSDSETVNGAEKVFQSAVAKMQIKVEKDIQIMLNIERPDEFVLPMTNRANVSLYFRTLSKLTLFKERSFAILKLLDKRFSSLSGDLLNETARAMQNHLCAYLLALEDSAMVLDTARRARKDVMERRRADLEELHRRDFLATFDFDEYNDRNEENNDEVDHLSQSMSQLSSQ